MIQKNLTYDPVRDVAPVEQDGFIDLVKASQSNSIPANLSADELSYNGIEDPRSIAGRPRNNFEAAQMSKVILGYKPPKNEE